MKIMMTGKNFELGDSLRQHIQDHIEKVVLKYFEHAFDVHIIMEKTKNSYIASIDAHIGRGIDLRVKESASEAYAAIDLGIHKLEQNLSRYKRRLTRHHNHHEVRKEDLAMQYTLENFAQNEEDSETNDTAVSPPIIAEMSTNVPYLTVSEAVMRMDLANEPVFAFRNKTHGRLNFVYHRKDGNIGWIDPNLEASK